MGQKNRTDKDFKNLEDTLNNIFNDRFLNKLKNEIEEAEKQRLQKSVFYFIAGCVSFGLGLGGNIYEGVENFNLLYNTFEFGGLVLVGFNLFPTKDYIKNYLYPPIKEYILNILKKE